MEAPSGSEQIELVTEILYQVLCMCLCVCARAREREREREREKEREKEFGGCHVDRPGLCKNRLSRP